MSQHTAPGSILCSVFCPLIHRRCVQICPQSVWQWPKSWGQTSSWQWREATDPSSWPRVWRTCWALSLTSLLNAPVLRAAFKLPSMYVTTLSEDRLKLYSELCHSFSQTIDNSTITQGLDSRTILRYLNFTQLYTSTPLQSRGRCSISYSTTCILAALATQRLCYRFKDVKKIKLAACRPATVVKR